MRFAYIYPETLLAKKARTISVFNTACALSNSCDTSLFHEAPDFNYCNDDCPTLQCIPIQRQLGMFRSNKIFHYRLKKTLYNDNLSYDIFYTRHLKTARFLQSIKKREKLIFECHELFHTSNPSLKSLEREVIESADGLIFINTTLQKVFNKTFTINHIPQAIIDNGCNFDFPYLPKDFSKIDSMLYVGNFYPWKGVDFLIETLKELPDSLSLVIVGGGKRRAELEEKVRQLGLQKRIQFLGYKTPNEVKKIMQEHFLSIIPNTPSIYTSFSTPIKLYEYLASSHIVVSADMPTVREIIRDDSNGFLFTPGDKKSLRLTIEKIMKLPTEKLQEISYAAWNTSKNFTWNARAEKIITFSESLL